MELLDRIYEFLFPFPIYFFAGERRAVIFLHDDIVGVIFLKSIQDVTLEDRLVQVVIQLGDVSWRLGCSAHGSQMPPVAEKFREEKPCIMMQLTRPGATASRRRSGHPRRANATSSSRTAER